MSTNQIPAFVQIMHPAHLAYITDLHANSLPYLFERLDAWDAEMRDHVLFFAYQMIIRPRRRPAITGQETLRELLLDEVSYEAFRQKCQHIVAAGALDGFALTSLIVHATLQFAFGEGNTTMIEQKIAETRQHIESIRTHSDSLLERGISKAAQYSMTNIQEKGIRELPENTRQAYDEYVNFCEHVVTHLLKENTRFSMELG